MKIAFYLADQNPQRDRSLGITRYTDGLLRALLERNDLALSALSSTSSYRPPREVENHQLGFNSEHAATRFVADNLHPLLHRSATDLWHYPKGHLPLFLRYRKPVVGTVHDLIVQHYADNYASARSRAAYAYWIAVLRRSIPRFDLILTVSKTSEAAIRLFCERYRLRCPPILVTYEGVQLEGSTLPTVQKGDYVVHLASTELHKRTESLIEAWQQLSSDSSIPRLKLIGTLRPEALQMGQRARNVEMCGRLPRRQLEEEIARARALIFPSEIEGFGLPAVEAYLLGSPVVYVTGTAVEEVLGEGTPGGFVFGNFESLREALRAVLEMPAAAVREIADGLLQRFSWAKCAEATVAAYRRLG